MPLDFDDAVAQGSKIFERLESAPKEQLPTDPPPAPSFQSLSPGPAPTRPNAYQHREAWLQALTGELRGPFKRLGHPIPEKIRIGVGFPSVRGIASKNQRIGECWSNTRSGDDHHEIIIS